jgi:hypothetical protein
MHAADSFVPQLSASEVEVAIGKFEKYKSPGVDLIPAELSQAGGETLRSEIHNLLSLSRTKNCPTSGKSQLWYLFTKRVIKLTVVIIEAYYCCQLLSRLTPYADETIGDHRCAFRHNRSMIDQVFYIQQVLEKKWEQNDTVHQLFIDFEKAYDSVRREVLYNILFEFGIPRKLAGLIKMCLNETYSTVCIGNNLSEQFPIHNGLKQGDALSQSLFNSASVYVIRRVQENREGVKLKGTHQLFFFWPMLMILI